MGTSPPAPNERYAGPVHALCSAAIGITASEIAFLVAAARAGVDYEQTLTIGRQDLFTDAAGIVTGCSRGGGTISLTEAAEIAGAGRYADALFTWLGATTVDSLDASEYEGATIIHDLNAPLPDPIRHRYSVVVDCGSLEHVFNAPRALESYMQLIGEDGHLIIVTAANNLFGHGLYQFSPDFFYASLTPANGFELQLMLIRHLRPGAGWRRVANPAEVGSRIELSSPWTTLLYVLAHRVAMVEPLRTAPQQSDYRAKWSESAGMLGTARLHGNAVSDRMLRLLRGAKLITAGVRGTMSDRSHFEPFDLTGFGVDRR